MKLGFVADAHGNSAGLRSCLEHLTDVPVDALYFLGDAIGYLPHGWEVLEELSRWKITCIMGNHDAMALGILPIDKEKDTIYRLAEVAASMPDDFRSHLMKGWPISRTLEHDGKRLLLVHGRPADPLQGYCYQDEQLTDAEFFNYDVIIMGHTHRPFIRRCGKSLLLNAGSCGLPRDIGNSASCVVYDTKTDQAELHRVPLNTAAIIQSCPAGSVATQVLDCLQRSINAEGW